MSFTDFQKSSTRIATAALFAVAIALVNSSAHAQCADGNCGINMATPAANSYQSTSYGSYTSYAPGQSYSTPSNGYYSAPMHVSYGYQPTSYNVAPSNYAPVYSTGYAPSYTSSYYTPNYQPVNYGYQPVNYAPVQYGYSSNYGGSYGGGCNGSSCGVY